MQRATSIRWLAPVGVAGVALFTLAMMALHILQPGLSPLHEAISYYVHGRHGWLTTLGLLALGFGSLALTIALRIQNTRSFWGLLFLGTWSVGAILGGMFAADPPGNWDRPPTVSGAIHGLAAMVALSTFPAAAVFLTRSFQRDPRWSTLQKGLSVLTVGVVCSYVVFMASLVPVFIRPGPPILLGLTERILFIMYVTWLAVVATGLFRIADVSLASP